MNHNAQQEFVLQTLLHITRLAAQEDYTSAIGFGLRPDQIRILSDMSTQQLLDLALSIKTSGVTIAVSQEIMDTALEASSQRQSQRELIIAMIRAGSTADMMYRFFGLSSSEHASYRKLLGLTNQGRPEIPSEGVQNNIWARWIAHAKLEIKARLLAVHQDTGEELRSIWQVVRVSESEPIRAQSASKHNVKRITSPV